MSKTFKIKLIIIKTGKNLQQDRHYIFGSEIQGTKWINYLNMKINKN
jgi:hypothetical protein